MNEKIFMLNWVEHEKSFITSGPGLALTGSVYIRISGVYNLTRELLVQLE